MSIDGSDDAAVNSAALVAAPLGLAVLAMASVCCLGSLMCCLTVWCQELYALVCICILLLLSLPSDNVQHELQR